MHFQARSASPRQLTDARAVSRPKAITILGERWILVLEDEEEEKGPSSSSSSSSSDPDCAGVLYAREKTASLVVVSRPRTCLLTWKENICRRPLGDARDAITLALYLAMRWPLPWLLCALAPGDDASECRFRPRIFGQICHSFGFLSSTRSRARSALSSFGLGATTVCADSPPSGGFSEREREREREGERLSLSRSLCETFALSSQAPGRSCGRTVGVCAGSAWSDGTSARCSAQQSQGCGISLVFEFG